MPIISIKGLITFATLIVFFSMVSARSSEDGELSVTSDSANATCHGMVFGQILTRPRDNSDGNGIHATVAEADMVERKGEQLTRIGDFNIESGRVHFELRAPLPARSNPAESSKISGDFQLDRVEAEELVCAANMVWAEPTSAISPGTKRLSQLVFWRFKQKKEVSGEGDFSEATQAYVELFWAIVAHHDHALKH